MASEVGVLPDLDPLTVVEKGRLQPGRMFLVDMNEGRIIPDEEVKERIYNAKPYQEWLDTYRITIDDLPDPAGAKGVNPAKVQRRRSPSATPTRTCVSCPGSDRASPAFSRSARWATTHRWPSFPTSEAPLPVFQADLCPGHQSGAGLYPRGTGDRDRDLHRIGGQPPPARHPRAAGWSAWTAPDRQHGPGQAARDQEEGFKSATLDALFPADQGRQGPREDGSDQHLQAARPIA
jgi:hypothetical protein